MSTTDNYENWRVQIVIAGDLWNNAFVQEQSLATTDERTLAIKDRHLLAEIITEHFVSIFRKNRHRWFDAEDLLKFKIYDPQDPHKLYCSVTVKNRESDYIEVWKSDSNLHKLGGPALTYVGQFGRTEEWFECGKRIKGITGPMQDSWQTYIEKFPDRFHIVQALTCANLLQLPESATENIKLFDLL